MNEWSIFHKHVMNQSVHIEAKTRPDTGLPKSCVGGQGPYLRSPDYLGRSTEVKKIKS